MYRVTKVGELAKGGRELEWVGRPADVHCFFFPAREKFSAQWKRSFFRFGLSRTT